MGFAKGAKVVFIELYLAPKPKPHPYPTLYLRRGRKMGKREK